MLKKMAWTAGVVMALMTSPAKPAIVIGATRVVFPAAQRDVAVRLQNKGDEPALVQVWIDDGDEASSPQTARGPFVITPPVFRIDPGHGHAVRIVHVGDTTLVDKEKLYWLNVLEIPPKADKAEGSNVLQFAFRHRLKLFHRPERLSSTVDQAAARLVWSLVRGDGAASLRVANPSPYVVSFNAIGLSPSDAPTAPTVPLGGGMVMPGGSLIIPVPSPTGSELTHVSYAVINDYGAVVPGTAKLAP